MRFITTLVLGTALALPAVAQTTHKTTKPHHAVHRTSTASPRETVDDKGPFTPEANRAYNGGGLITESPAGTAPSGSGQPMPATR